MGFQVGGSCFASVDAAAAAYVAFNGSSTVTRGDGCVFTQYFYSQGNFVGTVFDPMPGSASSCGARVYHGIYFAPPACDLSSDPLSLSAADGAAVGAAVVGVWLLGAIWRWLRSALGGHVEID